MNVLELMGLPVSQSELVCNWVCETPQVTLVPCDLGVEHSIGDTRKENQIFDSRAESRTPDPSDPSPWECAPALEISPRIKPGVGPVPGGSFGGNFSLQSFPSFGPDGAGFALDGFGSFGNMGGQGGWMMTGHKNVFGARTPPYFDVFGVETV